jgi:peptide deformylase
MVIYRIRFYNKTVVVAIHLLKGPNMEPHTFLENPPTKLVLYPDPVLLQKCAEITDLEPWAKIAPIMFALMKENSGCGLAAPQVGLPYSMFVLLTQSLVVINPKIISVGDRLWEMSEGCLSIPGKKFNIVRPQKVKAKWTNLEGATVTATYEGWTGRAFLHEYDHLQGILINAKNEQSPSK